MTVDPTFTLEFYEDPTIGRQPVRDWIKEKLTPFQRRSIGVAMSEILQRYGLAVCGTEYGRNLGGGLFEFRLRHGSDETIAMFGRSRPDRRGSEPVLLRVFCHAYGAHVVLLLGGYDKGAEPNRKRENVEINRARKRLIEFRARPKPVIGPTR